MKLIRSLAAKLVDNFAADDYHDFLKSRTVGGPFHVSGGVVFDPAEDAATSSGAGQAVWSMPLDGGMRPRFLSVEILGNPANPSTTDATAILVDHSGVKRTASQLDDGTSATWRWVDINLLPLIPSARPLPVANQGILTLRIEFAAAGIRARRVVMFYDRPQPRFSPLPDYPPGEAGQASDLARLPF